MAGNVKEFTDGNWKSEVLDSTIPVVVDFWAPWCGPCRMLQPTIEKLAGEYEAKVKPIVAQRCLACHDGSNPHIANLSSFDNISAVAQVDTGMSLPTLVRVSHIHMFGVTFIFFIMGTIFSHAYVRPIWLKSAVIALPFLAMIIDTGSWWLTKVNTVFAWSVMIGGAMMGLCFAFQWIVSMYQMWFYKYSLAEHPKTSVG